MQKLVFAILNRQKLEYAVTYGLLYKAHKNMKDFRRSVFYPLAEAADDLDDILLF